MKPYYLLGTSLFNHTLNNSYVSHSAESNFDTWLTMERMLDQSCVHFSVYMHTILFILWLVHAPWSICGFNWVLIVQWNPMTNYTRNYHVLYPSPPHGHTCTHVHVHACTFELLHTYVVCKCRNNDLQSMHWSSTVLAHTHMYMYMCITLHCTVPS